MRDVNVDNFAVVPSTAMGPRIPRRVQVIAGVMSFLTINALVFWLWSARPDAAAQPWLLVGFILAAIAVLLPSLERRRWRRAVNELSAALPAVRAGEMPIESLDAIKSNQTTLSALVSQIQALLRDQRAEVATLEQELRQRVAQRTDALERVIGSLRQQATRDALTGLFNRRFLDQYLPQLFDRSQADNTDLALLMMDVDHFKSLNDTLGHAAGDEMLRMTAQVIRSGIRGEDAAFRCGGDEFIVLMPGCGHEQAAELGEKLSVMVDGLSKRWKIATPPRLSVGVATRLGTSDIPPAGLLAEADRILYEKKRGPRRVPA